MCFSATASLTAAAIIGIIGIATLKEVRARSKWCLALIPLLFAFQQVSEGMVWLSLENHNAAYINLAKYCFLFFGLIVWPTWIPLSLRAAENDPQRKSFITFPLIIGIAVSLINIALLIKNGATVDTLGHRINYDAHLPYPEYLLLSYATAVLLPWFISSLKYTTLFGLLGLVSLLIAHFFYADTLTSVWCFFAALLSGLIYKIIRDSR